MREVARLPGGARLPIGRDGGRSSVGLTVIRLGVDDIKVTSDALVEEAGGIVRVDPTKVRLESAYDLGVFFNYAHGLGKEWSLGGNVKMIRQSLVGDGSSFGIGADLGLLWQPATAASFGLRLADITTTRRSSRSPRASSVSARPRSPSRLRSWNSSKITAATSPSSGSARIIRVNTPSVTTSIRVRRDLRSIDE